MGLGSCHGEKRLCAQDQRTPRRDTGVGPGRLPDAVGDPDGRTAEQIKCLLPDMASEQATLLGYFRAFIDRFDRRVGMDRAAGTAKNYRYACACLEAFLQAKYKLADLPFAALDRSFIDRFDLYLRTERRLAPRTIHRTRTRQSK